MPCTRLAAALMMALTAASAYAAPPAGYQLAWQDDFSGTELDLSKWKPATNRCDSAQRTADAYVFYVDDTERWRSSDAVSHVPEEVRLTCEVKDNGWAGRIPDGGYGGAGSSPHGMEVNWVKVWQMP